MTPESPGSEVRGQGFPPPPPPPPLPPPAAALQPPASPAGGSMPDPSISSGAAFPGAGLQEGLGPGLDSFMQDPLALDPAPWGMGGTGSGSGSGLVPPLSPSTAPLDALLLSSDPMPISLAGPAPWPGADDLLTSSSGPVPPPVAALSPQRHPSLRVTQQRSFSFSGGEGFPGAAAAAAAGGGSPSLAPPHFSPQQSIRMLRHSMEPEGNTGEPVLRSAAPMVPLTSAGRLPSLHSSIPFGLNEAAGQGWPHTSSMAAGQPRGWLSVPTGPKSIPPPAPPPCPPPHGMHANGIGALGGSKQRVPSSSTSPPGAGGMQSPAPADEAAFALQGSNALPAGDAAGARGDGRANQGGMQPPSAAGPGKTFSLRDELAAGSGTDPGATAGAVFGRPPLPNWQSQLQQHKVDRYGKEDFSFDAGGGLAAGAAAPVGGSPTDSGLWLQQAAPPRAGGPGSSLRWQPSGSLAGGAPGGDQEEEDTAMECDGQQEEGEEVISSRPASAPADLDTKQQQQQISRFAGQLGVPSSSAAMARQSSGQKPFSAVGGGGGAGPGAMEEGGGGASPCHQPPGASPPAAGSTRRLSEDLDDLAAPHQGPPGGGGGRWAAGVPPGWEDGSRGASEGDPLKQLQGLLPQPKRYCANCTAPLRLGDVCSSCRHDAAHDRELLGGRLMATAGAGRESQHLSRCAPLLAYDERLAAHGMPEPHSHPERPERAATCMARLTAAGLVARCYQVPCRPATFEELAAVHDRQLILDVRAAADSLAGDPEGMEDGESLGSAHILDCYIRGATYHCAALAAGAAADVATAVARGQAPGGAAIIRPPGHHAEGGLAMGFCFFNNAAVAARAAQRAGAQRVLILDWDVHHGNGTQQIFDNDPSVMYMSLHRYDRGNFFPGTGAVHDVGSGRGAGYSINIPWDGGGLRDGDYIAAFSRILVPIAYEFSPDLIIVSAGFDAAEGDPLGGCHLSPACYGHLTALLQPIAPLVLLLEGGYNLAVTAASVEACVRVMLGEPPARLKGLQPPTPVGLAGISRAQAVHSRYWRCLQMYPPQPVTRPPGSLVAPPSPDAPTSPWAATSARGASPQPMAPSVLAAAAAGGGGVTAAAAATALAAVNGVRSHPVTNGVTPAAFGGAGGGGGGFMQQQGQLQQHHEQQQGQEAPQAGPNSTPQAARQGAEGPGPGAAATEAAEEEGNGADALSDMDSDEEGEVPASPYHPGALG